MRQWTFTLPDGDDGTGDSGIWLETDAEDQWGNDHLYEWSADGTAEHNNICEGELDF